MIQKAQNFLSYRRNRFSTKLPLDRQYTAAHFWIQERGEGRLRIGLTKFATRMLGELVEAGAEVAVGDAVEVGQVIGWVEALKAASDLYSMAAGSFAGLNGELALDPELLQREPYGQGWLYEVDGTPEPEAMSAEDYAALLDQIIDKMLGESS